jgi:hypothetical protein
MSRKNTNDHLRIATTCHLNEILYSFNLSTIGAATQNKSYFYYPNEKK